MSHPLRADLHQGLNDLGISLNDRQIDQLLAYQDLIAKWTAVYNLTAVRDPQEMLRHHLLDSLAALPHLQKHLDGLGSKTSPQLLDVGSGAGLPGIVFAITCPQLQVTCVDTVGKKAAFIQQVAVSLGLAHLKALHARVETVQAASFDVVCSRAFASLVDFTQWSAKALKEQGVWLAMKGKYPQAEIAALPPTVELFHVEHLTVPGLNAERCLLWLKPSAKPSEAAPE